MLFCNHLAEEEYGRGVTPIFYVSNLVFLFIVFAILSSKLCHDIMCIVL